MIQQVNLYQLELKEAQGLSFWFMTKVVSGFVILLFFISVMNIYNHIKTKQELHVVELEQNETSQAMEKAKSKIPNAQTKEAYLEQIRHLETEQKTRKDMLATLINLQSTQTLGFSRYFNALASQVTSGVWLTIFKLDQDKNDISLEGIALRPDNVSHLMDGLSHESVFRGKIFQVFKLAVDEKIDHINFKLSTEEQPKS